MNTDEILVQLHQLEDQAAELYSREMDFAITQLEGVIQNPGDKTTAQIIAELEKIIEDQTPLIVNQFEDSLLESATLGFLLLSIPAVEKEISKALEELRFYTKERLRDVIREAYLFLTSPYENTKPFKSTISRKMTALAIRETIIRNFRRIIVENSPAGALFKYYASPLIIKETRPFCRGYAGQVKTLAEWRKIIPSRFFSLGGVNCRHYLIPQAMQL